MSNEQDKLDAFIARAGFTYGWRNLESWARRMAEQAVAEIEAAKSAAAPECIHEETERLGAIWTKCTQCGRLWSDDQDPPPAHLRRRSAAVEVLR